MRSSKRRMDERENGDEGESRAEQARQSADALRRRTFQAFDTRTERWHEAGLAVEIDRAAAKRAFGESIVLLAVIIGILIVFAKRGDLFPEMGKTVRYVTAGLLVILGSALTRTAGRGIAPVMFRRMDPGTAGTTGFLIRLVTVALVLFGSLAIAGVKPATLAVGGAFTAVILGLAAQQTLGNVIAGAMLLSARPFKVGDRVRLQGGQIGGQIEGVVATLGLFYVTLASGADRIMIPNQVLMNIAAVPLVEPDAVELTAKFDSTAGHPARAPGRPRGLDLGTDPASRTDRPGRDRPRRGPHLPDRGHPPVTASGRRARLRGPDRRPQGRRTGRRDRRPRPADRRWGTRSADPHRPQLTAAAEGWKVRRAGGPGGAAQSRRSAQTPTAAAAAPRGAFLTAVASIPSRRISAVRKARPSAPSTKAPNAAASRSRSRSPRTASACRPSAMSRLPASRARATVEPADCSKPSPSSARRVRVRAPIPIPIRATATARTAARARGSAAVESPASAPAGSAVWGVASIRAA